MFEWCALLVARADMLFALSRSFVLHHLPSVSLLDPELPIHSRHRRTPRSPSRVRCWMICLCFLVSWLLFSTPPDSSLSQHVTGTAFMSMVHAWRAWLARYWEPCKWVAKLRELKTDSNPVLFKVDLSSGHFSASDRCVTWCGVEVVQCVVRFRLHSQWPVGAWVFAPLRLRGAHVCDPSFVNHAPCRYRYMREKAVDLSFVLWQLGLADRRV